MPMAMPGLRLASAMAMRGTSAQTPPLARKARYSRLALAGQPGERLARDTSGSSTKWERRDGRNAR